MLIARILLGVIFVVFALATFAQTANEPPAPAYPTEASPWAREGEFHQRLKQLAHDEGYDLRDRTQRLAAIAVLMRQFPHLAPAYGFNVERPTPRNPSLGWGSQPPDQVVHDQLAAGPRRRQ